MEDGFSVETTSVEAFDREFKPMVDYPVERAARLYAAYSRMLGATEEAMQELSQLTEVTNEDIKMAIAKKKAKAAAGTVKAQPKGKSNRATKANEEQTLKASVKTGTTKADLPNGKKPAAKAVAKKASEPKAKKEAGDKKPRESAAGMFCDLIRDGKVSDDQIFAKVQERFGLDDKKRSYVSWYRNYLRKNGETVPDAK